MLISNTAELSEKWIKRHKKEIEYNPKIVADYGVEPGDVWKVDQVEIKKDGKMIGSITAKGSGAQIRGDHPTELVIDDLENREEARSETIREKVRAYFWQDLWGTLRHEGADKTRVKIVGTFVHPLGLLPRLYKDDRWKKVKYAVYTGNREPLWPDYMDSKALEKLEKHLMDEMPSAWASEYLNQPIISENPIFVDKWIHYYDSKDELSFLGALKEGVYTVVAIDPAISRRDSADYTAIVVISATFAAEPKYYVRAKGVVRGRWVVPRTVAEAARLYQEFNANALVVETTAFQQVVADEFRRYCKSEHFDPRVFEIKPLKDKESRAHNIESLLSRGQVFFDPDDKMTQLLIDEMLMFPTGSHDDMVDAFVYALTQLKQWARRGQNQQTGPCIVLPGKPRPYTGVIG